MRCARAVTGASIATSTDAMRNLLATTDVASGAFVGGHYLGVRKFLLN